MKAIQLNPSIPRYVMGRAFGNMFPHVLWSGLSCTQYVDVPEPSLPGDDWVKIKTRFGGICGSDLSAIRLHSSMSLTPFCSFPAILGHEGVGNVCELGRGVHDFRSGERVVVEPALSCTPRGVADLCRSCQRGEINLCEHWADGKLSPGMFIGVCRETGGTWSPKFAAHSSQLYHIPDGVSDKNALMVEPFATALHTVLHNFPGDDETLVILGAGTIGLCVITALRVLGSKAKLIVIARHSFQAKAAEKAGASSVIVGGGSGALREVASSTGAKIMRPIIGELTMVGGADRVIECAGTESSIRNALTMTRSGGQVVLVGVPGWLKLDWSSILIKELTIRASYIYHHAEEFDGKKQSTFDITLNLMQTGKVDLEWMVTHEFHLADYKAAFDMLSRRGNQNVIKAVFGFD